MQPIGYVVHVRTPGLSGGETRSYQMAQALGRASDGVYLYGQVDLNHVWIPEVKPHPLKTPFPFGIWQLLRDFNRLNIDVAIERYQFPPFNVATFAQLIRRKPIILEVHGFPIDEYILQTKRRDKSVGMLSHMLASIPKTVWLRLQRFLFKRITHFIVTSAGTKDILIEFGVPAERVTVVYNCVDPTMFDTTKFDRSSAREALGLPMDKCLVLYAGTMTHEELGIVLETVKPVIAARPDVQYVMVGGGDLTALKTKVQQLGLTEEQVLFRPPVQHQHMPQLLKAVDVVLAPYHLQSERFKVRFHYAPLKVMEALAMEKPVVTVNAEELHRVFDTVPNVQFVESGDAQAWETGILHALDMDTQISKGRDFVMKGYRWQDAAAQYLDVIEKATAT